MNAKRKGVFDSFSIFWDNNRVNNIFEVNCMFIDIFIKPACTRVNSFFFVKILARSAGIKYRYFF